MRFHGPSSRQVSLLEVVVVEVVEVAVHFP